MKRFFLLLLLLPGLLIAASCTDRMDPFEGADGVRANINGHKCVMDGVHGKTGYVTYNAGPGASMDIEVNMKQELTQQYFGMKFHLQADGVFQTGKDYAITKTGDNTAKITGPFGSPGEDVALEGVFRFLKLDYSSFVEAEFEMDGKAEHSGESYAVRHGFLRLYKKKRP